MQNKLFPWLQEELDPLTKKQQQLVTILEIVRIDQFIPSSGWKGHPEKSRTAIARAFGEFADTSLPERLLRLAALRENGEQKPLDNADDELVGKG